jgi:hypothetical protein
MYNGRMFIAGFLALNTVVMAPQRAPQERAKGTKTTSTKLSLVTTGRIRMTDPDTLLRIQRTGGRATGMLRANERRNDLLPGLRQRETRQRKRSELPAFAQTFTTPPAEGTLYGALFGSSGNYTFDAAFGDIAKGMQAPKGHYDGVASKTGLVSVDQVTGGPFLATKVVTYTGYWVNGEPQVDQQKMAAGKSFSVPVKAGQEYTVFYMFDSTKLNEGAYKGTSAVYDGAKTTLNITGNVVPAKGDLYVGVGAYNSMVGTGQTREIPLTILYKGNLSKVTVSPSAKFFGGNVPTASLKILKSVELTPGVPKEIKLFAAAENVVDGQYPVEVQFSAPGAPVTTQKLDLSFKTLWLDSGKSALQIFAGDVKAFPQMRMNSLGYWECSGDAYSTTLILDDRMQLAVFTTAVVQGSRHGVYYDVTLTGGTDPSTANLMRSGYSSVVQNNFGEFASGGFSAAMGVNDPSGFGKILGGIPITALENNK